MFLDQPAPVSLEQKLQICNLLLDSPTLIGIPNPQSGNRQPLYEFGQGNDESLGAVGGHDGLDDTLVVIPFGLIIFLSM